MFVFLKGKPKIANKNKLSKELLDKKDYYFTKIKILKIGKKLANPILNYKNKEGIRQYSNEMEGKIVYVGKITLEEYIKYHEIEYKILDAVYFRNGINTKGSDLMTEMFNLRLKYKKEKNPLQLVIKLLMNSFYGKTILKDSKYKIVYINGKETFLNYIHKNYRFVKESSKLNGCEKYRIKVYNNFYIHQNICQVGSIILEMSKRMMNEVIQLGEQNSIKVYYQDTDSMHICQSKLETLENLYYDKFEKELVGFKMGQFHSDFELFGSVKEVISEKFIMLGKKFYLDMLVGGNEKGEIIKDYHIRAKGLSKNCILLMAKEKYNNKIEDLYLDLFNHKKLDFDLTKGRAMFKFDLNKNTVKSEQTFIRSVRF